MTAIDLERMVIKIKHGLIEFHKNLYMTLSIIEIMISRKKIKIQSIEDFHRFKKLEINTLNMKNSHFIIKLFIRIKVIVELIKIILKIVNR